MNMRKISINEFKKRRFERSYISVYIVIRSISVENEQEIEVKNLCVIYGFTALGVRRIIAIYFENTNDNRFWLGVFEALMGQYYEYVSQDQDAVLQLAKEAESSYNRYIRTKSGDYFKVKKEAAIQRRIAGYYEKGGNGKKADSLRKDAEKREKNSKKGIREEN